MKKSVLFEKKEKNLIKCTACRHYCMIADGFSGRCGVRANKGGELFLRVYGKAIAVQTDPVEKKPLFHFLPGARVFSLGTIGCNFRCSFCQNWDISQATQMVRDARRQARDDSWREDSEIVIGKICDEGQSLSPKEIVEYCVENKIPMIAYTYNEPTIFVEYAHDTAVLAKKKGIKNVFVTNGYETPECLEYMAGWCDAMNIDIKSFSEKFYNEECGGIHLKGVLDTVRLAWKAGIWVECTTLVIPGLNDSDKELGQIAEFMASVSADMPWHVSAFHPDYKMQDRGSTPAETLARAYKIGKKAGLKYVYTGNIPGMPYENTHCPKCDEVLVERTGMDCLENKIFIDKKGKGKCPKCEEKIMGIWKTDKIRP